MTSRSSGSFRLDYVIYSFIAGPVGIVVFCAFFFSFKFSSVRLYVTGYHIILACLEYFDDKKHYLQTDYASSSL